MMGQADIMCTLCSDTPRRIHHLFCILAQIFNLNEETTRQIQINEHLAKTPKNKKLVLTLQTKEGHVWVFQLAARTRPPATSKH